MNSPRTSLFGWLPRIASGVPWTLFVLTRLTLRLLSAIGCGSVRWIVLAARILAFAALTSSAWWKIVPWYLRSPHVIKGVRYGRHRRNDADVYIPPTGDGDQQPVSRPVVVCVPGGAWVIGYKFWAALLCRKLATNGIVAVAVDYRNYPQTCVSGMIEDVNDALDAILVGGMPPDSSAGSTRSNTLKQPRTRAGTDPRPAAACSPLRRAILDAGGDLSCVYLWGQSAGAHLAACVVLERAICDTISANAAAGSAAAAAATATGDPSRSLVYTDQTPSPSSLCHVRDSRAQLLSPQSELTEATGCGSEHALPDSAVDASLTAALHASGHLAPATTIIEMDSEPSESVTLPMTSTTTAATTTPSGRDHSAHVLLLPTRTPSTSDALHISGEVDHDLQRERPPATAAYLSLGVSPLSRRSITNDMSPSCRRTGGNHGRSSSSISSIGGGRGGGSGGVLAIAPSSSASHPPAPEIASSSRTARAASISQITGPRVVLARTVTDDAVFDYGYSDSEGAADDSGDKLNFGTDDDDSTMSGGVDRLGLGNISRSARAIIKSTPLPQSKPAAAQQQTRSTYLSGSRSASGNLANGDVVIDATDVDTASSNNNLGHGLVDNTDAETPVGSSSSPSSASASRSDTSAIAPSVRDGERNFNNVRDGENEFHLRDGSSDTEGESTDRSVALQQQQQFTPPRTLVSPARVSSTRSTAAAGVTQSSPLSSAHLSPSRTVPTTTPLSQAVVGYVSPSPEPHTGGSAAASHWRLSPPTHSRRPLFPASATATLPTHSRRRCRTASGLSGSGSSSSSVEEYLSQGATIVSFPSSASLAYAALPQGTTMMSFPSSASLAYAALPTRASPVQQQQQVSVVDSHDSDNRVKELHPPQLQARRAQLVEAQLHGLAHTTVGAATTAVTAQEDTDSELQVDLATHSELQLGSVHRIRRFFGVSGPYDIPLAAELFEAVSGIPATFLDRVFEGTMERYSPVRWLPRCAAAHSAAVLQLGAEPAVAVAAAAAVIGSVNNGTAAANNGAAVADSGAAAMPPKQRLTASAANVPNFNLVPPLDPAQLPPFSLFHGSCDRAVPSSSSTGFYAVLRSVGVSASLRVFDLLSHTDPILECPMGGKDPLLNEILNTIRQDQRRDAAAADAAADAAVEAAVADYSDDDDGDDAVGGDSIVHTLHTDREASRRMQPLKQQQQQRREREERDTRRNIFDADVLTASSPSSSSSSSVTAYSRSSTGHSASFTKFTQSTMASPVGLPLAYPETTSSPTKTPPAVAAKHIFMQSRFYPLSSVARIYFLTTSALWWIYSASYRAVLCGRPTAASRSECRDSARTTAAVVQSVAVGKQNHGGRKASNMPTTPCAAADDVDDDGDDDALVPAFCLWAARQVNPF